MVSFPADLSVWYGNDTIYNVLVTHGLTHGYSTNFWYVNSITVLSESRINVLPVNITDDGFTIDNALARGAWYREAPTEQRTFLICWERELLRQYPWLEDEAVELYRATQYTPAYHQSHGYFILVYDHDIIAEQIQDCNSGGDAGERIQEN